MSFDFNIKDVQVAATQQARDTVPDGEYLVVITVADKDFRTPKTGQPGLKMEYNIQTGPHEGKSIDELLFYSNEEVVKNKVAQMAVAVGLTGGFTAKDVEKFPGKRILVTLKSKQVGDKTYQNVTRYNPAMQVPPPQAVDGAALPWKH